MWFDSAIDVMPAIDLLGDQAVRLEQGDYSRIVERADSPESLAERWVAAGAHWLHLVDLDGARDGRIRPAIVRRVAEAAGSASIQASGGIRSVADATALLEAGASRVVVGTAAWPEPEPWLELGAVIALDVRDGKIWTRGWTNEAPLTLPDALARVRGARVLLTAIDRDGTLAGPDLRLVETAAAAGVAVIAAGGIRSPDDVVDLARAGAEAAVVGRALFRQ